MPPDTPLPHATDHANLEALRDQYGDERRTEISLEEVDGSTRAWTLDGTPTGVPGDVDWSDRERATACLDESLTKAKSGEAAESLRMLGVAARLVAKQRAG